VIDEISIEEAIKKNLPIIDVRSPGEFQRGHIPGAFNIPLFSDEERAHIGTVYKQRSSSEALELGYRYVTPKLDWFVEESRKVAPQGTVIVHCWRGGMRSEAFAGHLHEHGFQKVYRIRGGYKAFRNYVLSSFEQPFPLLVLGGYTGSGKTLILHELENIGWQAIDLEGLANHKGSAFGSIGQKQQPTVEHFENLLFDRLRKLDTNREIWVEDESHNIGKVKIPLAFYRQMQQAPLFFVDIPVEKRIEQLVADYGKCDDKQLADAIVRITKRLGGQNAKLALEFLSQKNYGEVARITLAYYDKSYRKALDLRNPNRITRIPLPDTHAAENANQILRIVNKQLKND